MQTVAERNATRRRKSTMKRALFSSKYGTIPTSTVTSDGVSFFTAPFRAPIQVKVRTDLLITVRFNDEPDVVANYVSPYGKSSWDERVVEAVAVAELATIRADQIWDACAEEESRLGGIALMLTGLGFRVNC